MLGLSDQRGIFANNPNGFSQLYTGVYRPRKSSRPVSRMPDGRINLSGTVYTIFDKNGAPRIRTRRGSGVRRRRNNRGSGASNLLKNCWAALMQERRGRSRNSSRRSNTHSSSSGQEIDISRPSTSSRRFRVRRKKRRRENASRAHEVYDSEDDLPLARLQRKQYNLRKRR